MKTIKKFIYFGFSAMLALAFEAAVICGCRTCYGLPAMISLALVGILGLFSSTGIMVHNRSAN